MLHINKTLYLIYNIVAYILRLFIHKHLSKLKFKIKLIFGNRSVPELSCNIWDSGVHINVLYGSGPSTSELIKRPFICWLVRF